MIRFGKAEYVPAMKKLWQQVFGDSDAYLAAFFQQQYEDRNTLVYVADNKPVAALYMIPYKMRIASEVVDVVYLYALATAPSFRGQGIMSSLIERSFEIAYERGYVLSILIPAEKSLFDYYRRFGYETCFDKSTVTLDTAMLTKIVQTSEPMPLEKADAEQVWQIYEKSYLLADKCVLLSQRQNAFNIHQLEAENGGALVFDMKDEAKGYALVSFSDEKIHVHQCLIGRAYVPSFVAALARKAPQRQMVFTQPSYFQIEGAVRKLTDFAMARIIRVDKAAALLAREHRNAAMHLKVRDAILPANNGGYEIFGNNIRPLQPDDDEFMNLGLLAQILTGYRIGNLIRRDDPNLADYFPSPTPYLSMTLM